MLLSPNSRKGPSWISSSRSGTLDAEIGIYPDEVGIEGGMMELRERQPIRDDRLPKLLVLVHQDVGVSDCLRILRR